MPPTTTWTCAQCSSVFAKSKLLERHALQSEHKAYGCISCSKTFSKRTALIRHNTTHTSTKSHACCVCKKAFYRKDHCQEHEELCKHRSAKGREVSESLSAQLVSGNGTRGSLEASEEAHSVGDTVEHSNEDDQPGPVVGEHQNVRPIPTPAIPTLKDLLAMYPALTSIDWSTRTDDTSPEYPAHITSLESSIRETNSAPELVAIHYFSCCSLQIGAWRPAVQSTADLVVSYLPERAILSYCFMSDGFGYKMEVPFSSIKRMRVAGPFTRAPAGVGGAIWVVLKWPPNFYTHSPEDVVVPCADFTDNKQASRLFDHTLIGNYEVLSEQLAKLESLEVYQNRHLAVGL